MPFFLMLTITAEVVCFLSCQKLSGFIVVKENTIIFF